MEAIAAPAVAAPPVDSTALPAGRRFSPAVASLSSLSSSPSAASLLSPSAVLLGRFERAKAQLRAFLPFGRSSPAPLEESKLGGGVGPLSSATAALTPQEAERRQRVASAFACLASFVRGEDEAEAELSRDEVLNRAIALYTYTRRYLEDRRRALSLLASSPQAEALEREEREEEGCYLRRLSEASRRGLRSQSAIDPPSLALSPALVTLLAITQSQLCSRQVTDLAVTLELMAAILAWQSETVQRLQRREAELRAVAAEEEKAGGAEEEAEERLYFALPPTPRAAVAGVADVAPSPDAERHSPHSSLLAALTALPPSLQSAASAFFLRCCHAAAQASAGRASEPAPSLAPDAFASSLRTFQVECRDAVRPPSRGGGGGGQWEQSTDEEELKAEPRHAAASSEAAATRAVAKVVRKEEKAERRQWKAEEKRRRNAANGRGKGKDGRRWREAEVEAGADSEAEELSRLVAQMDGPPPAQWGGGGDVDAGALVERGGWQLFPTSRASQPPALSPSSPSPSPFAYQPFPYRLPSRHRPHAGGAERPSPSSPPAPLPSALVPSAPVASAEPALHPPRLSSAQAFPPLPSSSSFAHLAARPPSQPQPPAPLFPSAPPPLPLHPPPSPALQSLLCSLRLMGFVDDGLNARALQQSGLDLNATVDRLLALQL